VYCYDNVPAITTFDAQVSKRFTVGAQKLLWSINASNLTDKKYVTFAGVPQIGRMVLTRLQFQF
jgi:iron complex outermembrane receptor protein